MTGMVKPEMEMKDLASCLSSLSEINRQSSLALPCIHNYKYCLFSAEYWPSFPLPDHTFPSECKRK